MFASWKNELKAVCRETERERDRQRERERERETLMMSCRVLCKFLLPSKHLQKQNETGDHGNNNNKKNEWF